MGDVLTGERRCPGRIYRSVKGPGKWDHLDGLGVMDGSARDVIDYTAQHFDIHTAGRTCTRVGHKIKLPMRRNTFSAQTLLMACTTPVAVASMHVDKVV